MFVRSRMEKDVTYRRKGNVWVIKANSVTYIDENKVRAKELKSLYGSRIEIMSRDVLEEMEKEIPVNKEVVKKVEKKNPVENIEKPLDNTMLNDILSEIKKEIKEEKVEVKEDVIDPIKDTLMGNVELTVVKPDAITEIPIQVTVGDEIKDKLEVQTVPLQVKKDEFGNIVLDPVEVQTAEMTEEQIKDKLEVQSSTVEEGKGIPTLKEEENKKGKEEKDKENKTIKKVVAKKAVTGKRRGRKKATVK